MKEGNVKIGRGNGASFLSTEGFLLILFSTSVSIHRTFQTIKQEIRLNPNAGSALCMCKVAWDMVFAWNHANRLGCFIKGKLLRYFRYSALVTYFSTLPSASISMPCILSLYQIPNGFAVLSTTLKCNLVKIRMSAVLCHAMSFGARDNNAHFCNLIISRKLTSQF